MKKKKLCNVCPYRDKCDCKESLDCYLPKAAKDKLKEDIAIQQVK